MLLVQVFGESEVMCGFSTPPNSHVAQGSPVQFSQIEFKYLVQPSIHTIGIKTVFAEWCGESAIELIHGIYSSA